MAHQRPTRYKIVLSLIFLLVMPALAMEKGPTPNPLPLSSALPFAPGEKLTYDVQYLGVSSGVAVLAVLEAITQNGQEVYPLLSTVQSSDFSSIFYRVNDRIESFLNPKALYSHAIFVKQHEGKRKREKQITFDQVTHKATLIENGQQTVFDIPPKVNDSLSSLYVFRTFHPLTVGQSMFIDLHEGKKNGKLEIAVLGKERVKTPIGDFNAIKLQTTPRYEGTSSTKGRLLIWVTDDDRKIPVLIKSKAKFGSIVMTLIARRDGEGHL
ncbi:MAG: DUF3108 domain-containing protein [Nitrospirota bacterium]